MCAPINNINVNSKRQYIFERKAREKNYAHFQDLFSVMSDAFKQPHNILSNKQISISNSRTKNDPSLFVVQSQRMYRIRQTSSDNEQKTRMKKNTSNEEWRRNI